MDTPKIITIICAVLFALLLTYGLVDYYIIDLKTIGNCIDSRTINTQTGKNYDHDKIAVLAKNSGYVLEDIGNANGSLDMKKDNLYIELWQGGIVVKTNPIPKANGCESTNELMERVKTELYKLGIENDFVKRSKVRIPHYISLGGE